MNPGSVDLLRYGAQILNPLTSSQILWGIGKSSLFHLLRILTPHRIARSHCITNSPPTFYSSFIFLLPSPFHHHHHPPTTEKTPLTTASIFLFLLLISIIPLLWVHENAALHAIANGTLFTVSSVSSPSLAFLPLSP